MNDQKHSEAREAAIGKFAIRFGEHDAMTQAYNNIFDAGAKAERERIEALVNGDDHNGFLSASYVLEGKDFRFEYEDDKSLEYDVIDNKWRVTDEINDSTVFTAPTLLEAIEKLREIANG